MKPVTGEEDFDDDDPPPLEDLTDQIEATLALKSSLNQSEKVSSNTSIEEQKQNTSQIAQKQSRTADQKAGFGGLSKGFLFGSKPAKKQATSKTEKALTVIKSQPENNSLKFKEVEDAQNTPSWITNSLLG